MIFRILLLAITFSLPNLAAAVEPDEMLDDPVLEERAREISKVLRCVVCLNQNIDSSNAGVARDLRILVRERLVTGESDEQVIAFIQARYGDYVLLKPPLNAKTYALWFAPIGLLLSAVVIGVLALRSRQSATNSKDLSDAEESEVLGIIEEAKAGERH